jgi:hypothetical protein
MESIREQKWWRDRMKRREESEGNKERYEKGENNGEKER